MLYAEIDNLHAALIAVALLALAAAVYVFLGVNAAYKARSLSSFAALHYEQESSDRGLLLEKVLNENAELRAAVRQCEEDSAHHQKDAQEAGKAHHEAVTERERWAKEWSAAEDRVTVEQDRLRSLSQTYGICNTKLQVEVTARRECESRLEAAEKKSAALHRDVVSFQANNDALRQRAAAAEKREADAVILLGQIEVMAASVSEVSGNTTDAQEGA